MDEITGTPVPHLTGEHVFRRPDYTNNLMGEARTITLTTPPDPFVVGDGCTVEEFPWQHQRVLADGRIQHRFRD